MAACLTAIGTRNSCGTWDHTVLPGRGDIPTSTAANKSWYLIQQPWRDTRLSWIGYRQKTVTHPSTNRARHGVT